MMDKQGVGSEYTKTGQMDTAPALISAGVMAVPSEQ